jgi:hypothetical protein
LRIADCEWRTGDCGFRSSDFGFRNPPDPLVLAQRRQRDGLRAVLREAGDTPEQDSKRSEECDWEAQELRCVSGRSRAYGVQCMRNHARSYTPKANKVISANPDRRKALVVISARS